MDHTAHPILDILDELGRKPDRVVPDVMGGAP